MIRPHLLLASAAIVLPALALPHAALAQSVSDFRLPPSPADTPTVDPDQQGPVAQDVPDSQPQAAPAPTPAPTPAATRRPPVVTVPSATPVVQPVPRASENQPSVRAPQPRASASPASQPLPAAAATPEQTATPPAGTATDSAAIPGDTAPLGDAPAIVPPTAILPPPAPTASDTDGDITSGLPAWALWTAGIITLLGVLIGLLWLSNRRGMPVARKVAPIERPQLPPVAADPAEEPADVTQQAQPVPPTATAAPAAAPVALRADATPEAAASLSAGPLTLQMEPLRFGLTLMNASLPYRLILSNGQAESISDIRVVADMISAHASLPREQQLAGPAADAAPAHRIDQIAPGESHELKGELRLPFPQITPIRQGNLTMMLPLVRFRIETADGEIATRLFVVGQTGAGAGLQPFRLDQGPRNFTQLAHRAFA